MTKFWTLLLCFLIFFGLTLPAQAAICRTVNQHRICILKIKRSAKYYWEYRAAVSTDGVARPIEIYNCRDRLWTRQDGKQIRFQTDSPGELICSLVKQK
jgi:hypothetical protein